VRPPEQRPTRKWPYYLLHVGKFAAAVPIIYLLVRHAPETVLYFGIGYTMPIVVLALKVAGTELNRYLGVSSSAEDDDPRFPDDE